jgi:hypothetical protein
MIHRLASFLMPLSLGLAVFNHPGGVMKIAVFVFSWTITLVLAISAMVVLGVLAGALWYALRKPSEDSLKLARAIRREHRARVGGADYDVTPVSLQDSTTKTQAGCLRTQN